MNGDVPSAKEPESEDVFEEGDPVLSSPIVDADDTREERDVMEFLRDPKSEGDGVVIGDTNDNDPLDSRLYD